MRHGQTEMDYLKRFICCGEGDRQDIGYMAETDEGGTQLELDGPDGGCLGQCCTRPNAEKPRKLAANKLPKHVWTLPVDLSHFCNV